MSEFTASVIKAAIIFLIAAGICFAFHYLWGKYACKKLDTIRDIRDKIRAKLDFDEAMRLSLKALGESAPEAAVMGLATSGISLLNVYAGMDGHEEAMAALGSLDGSDAAGAAEGLFGDSSMALAENIDVTDSVPAVALALFTFKSARNLRKYKKDRQTGRETGINMSLDAARIGVGGVTAVGLGKLGALAGSLIFPGAGTVIGGGIGVFAGSLAGSYVINYAKEKVKWGKIIEAQEYFGHKLLDGQSDEFAARYTEEFFGLSEIDERMAEEERIFAGYKDEMNPYSRKKASIPAVLSGEYIEYLKTLKEKAGYVQDNLISSVGLMCSNLAMSVPGNDSGENMYRLAGELVLRHPECMELTEAEQKMLADYQNQQAGAKDYPCRFDKDGSDVLGTISMQLFNKCEPLPRKETAVKRPGIFLTLGCGSLIGTVICLALAVI